MPTPRQLLIAMAASTAPGGQQALRTLQLPQLDRLLSRLTLIRTDVGLETDYAPPHERALAHALGLPEAATPWAAWEQARRGAPSSAACAWISPCHWQVGADHVTLLHPGQLALTEQDGRELVAILAPWMAQDGITLTCDEPTRWLARGEVFEDLACAALERAVGRDVRAWLPRGPRATFMQRLHSEVQMLLYAHPWSEARAARGQLAVNAFWVHGAGRLDKTPAAATEPETVRTLSDPALAQDWAAWARAWQQLDAGPVAELLRHVVQGGTAELTLSGERSALTFATAHRGLGQKIVNIFRPQRFADVCEQL